MHLCYAIGTRWVGKKWLCNIKHVIHNTLYYIVYTFNWHNVSSILLPSRDRKNKMTKIVTHLILNQDLDFNSFY